MDSLPFQNAARGLAHADVAQMLSAQMELARQDPAGAISLLDEVTFDEAEPGADRDEVFAWMQAQREWLLGRLEEPSDISVAEAIDGFAAAVDRLRQAVALEARNAEARAAAAAAQAELRCDAMVRQAEQRLAEKLARSRRKIRKDAEGIRRNALADAERLLERAGKQAAAMLMNAERSEQDAAAEVSLARTIQAELLAGIEAARSTVRAQPHQAA